MDLRKGYNQAPADATRTQQILDMIRGLQQQPQPSRGEIRQYYPTAQENYLAQPSIAQSLENSPAANSYYQGHENVKEAWDKYFIPPEDVANARQFYEDLGMQPGMTPLAALGATLVGPVYDEYRNVATDPAGLMVGAEIGGIQRMLNEAKHAKEALGAFATVTPRKFDENIINTLRRWLKGQATPEQTAQLMRLQKSGYVIDPLDAQNILDVASINPARIPGNQLLKDIDANRKTFGNANRADINPTASQEQQLKDFIAQPEDFQASHFQTDLRGGVPGAHFSNTDAELLSREQALTKSGANFQKNHWGPAVYHYPTDWDASARLRASGADEFVKDIPASDIARYVSPQLALDYQAPLVRDAFSANKSVFDIGATEGLPLWQSLQQLQTAVPENTFLTILRNMGIKGTQEFDRGIGPDMFTKRHEFGDFDFVNAPWKKVEKTSPPPPKPFRP